MTNQEMSRLIKDMVDLVEANNRLQRDGEFKRLKKVIEKLENDQELNIDDKQSLNDLMYSLYIDSIVMWDFGCSTIMDFNAVREQLGCRNLEYNRYTTQEHQLKMEQIQVSKLFYKYDVGIICSVRTGTDKEYIEEYVRELEKLGIRVFYPSRDTEQVDETGGIRICYDNCNSLRNCREIHIIFHPESQGTLFDFGMVFAMNKPIHIVNPLIKTDNKSFKNVLLSLEEEYTKQNNIYGQRLLFDIDFDKEIELR